MRLLGLMYGSTGSSELATENVARAYELRDRASDKERFLITSYYFSASNLSSRSELAILTPTGNSSQGTPSWQATLACPGLAAISHRGYSKSKVRSKIK